MLSDKESDLEQQLDKLERRIYNAAINVTHFPCVTSRLSSSNKTHTTLLLISRQKSLTLRLCF